MPPFLYVVAGGLVGGLLRCLMDNNRTFPLPGRATDDVTFSFGGFADVLIGGAAGLGLAAVAPFVLNPELVRSLGLVAGGGSSPSSWFVPLGVGILIGFGSRRLLPILSDSVVQVVGREVKERTKEIAKTVDQRIDMKQEILSTALDPLMALIKKEAAGLTKATLRGSSRDGQAEAMAEIKRIATEYEAISPDVPYRQRLDLKERCASEMAAIAIGSHVDRKMLVDTFEANHQEGLVLALAALVTSDPQVADGDRLLHVSSDLKRLHVRYRVLSALSRLQEKHLLSEEERRGAIRLVDRYRPGADPSLERKIEVTLQLLDRPKP